MFRFLRVLAPLALALGVAGPAHAIRVAVDFSDPDNPQMTTLSGYCDYNGDQCSKVYSLPWSVNFGNGVFNRIVIHGSGLDGVVCYEDYTAIGLIMEMLSRGLSVPKDVAVVGSDDLPIGDVFTIGLTTYAYPSERMAEQAVRVMRERLKDPGAAPIKVVVPGRLIVRESTVGTAVKR